MLISIHALRVEGDTNRFFEGDGETISIHALRVEGDGVLGMLGSGDKDFYPRPPGGGRPTPEPMSTPTPEISIHALRVEGDNKIMSPSLMRSTISIHALRVEGDQEATNTSVEMQIFLSTPSGWRATFPSARIRHCGRISIHALRVEGD